MPHRKTMHILCIALRVSNQEIARHVCKIVGTKASVDRRRILVRLRYRSPCMYLKLQRKQLEFVSGLKLLRLGDIQAIAQLD